MRYRLIIFDFDGTLADSFPWFLGAMDQIAARFGGRSIDQSELPRLRQLSPKQLLEHLELPLWRVPQIVGYARQLMAQHTGEIRLFPGIEDMLLGLASEGIKICVVSSNSERNVRTILGAGNAPFIAAYECGTSIFGKGARFRRVLKRLGFTNTEAICIGDEIRDIDAAQEAGIPCGAVTWGYADVTALSHRGPDVIFEAPTDILRLCSAPASS